MKRLYFTWGVGIVAIFGFLLVTHAQAIDKVIIGHPACLSGKLAKEGAQAQWGIQASLKWINEVNGGVEIGDKKFPFEYKRYDCESRKEVVTSLIERLIQIDKVNGVVAPYSSGLTITGASVAEKYGAIYMSHGGASNRIFEQGYRYAVQMLSPATLYQAGALDMLRKADPKARRIALAFEDDEFARMVLVGAEKRAKELGFEVVFNRTYPKGVADLTPLLSDLKGAKPDVIVGGGHFQDGQLMARQIADLDINVKAISMIVAVTLPSFNEALGNIAEGMFGPAQWEFGVRYSPEEAKKVGLPWFGPTNEEWVKLAKEFSGGKEPDYHAAEAGQAPLVYAEAVKMANSVDSDKVRGAFNRLDLMTFFGGFKLDKDSGLQIGHTMVVVQWQNGKKVIVWPQEAATAKYFYPMPTFAEKAKGLKAVSK
ncbi:MAG: amino acid ABC transporter substrate-binding protein [Pseudomonadota bacterium]